MAGPSDRFLFAYGLTLDAIGRNLDSGVLGMVLPSSRSDPVRAALDGCRRLRAVPYWFSPADTRRGILDWKEIARTGRAACMEAASLAASLALAAGSSTVDLCIEESPQVPGYAHLRAIVEGTTIDCYQERSLVVPSCSEVWTIGKPEVANYHDAKRRL